MFYANTEYPILRKGQNSNPWLDNSQQAELFDQHRGTKYQSLTYQSETNRTPHNKLRPR